MTTTIPHSSLATTGSTSENLEKPKRGRPRGSKTKNRLRGDTILCPTPIRRPRHYNQIAAAAELGISHDVLYRLAGTHQLYKPAAVRSKSVIYTDTQIEIISLVMREKMTEDEGLKMWKLIEDSEIKAIMRRGMGAPNTVV